MHKTVDGWQGVVGSSAVCATLRTLGIVLCGQWEHYEDVAFLSPPSATCREHIVEMGDVEMEGDVGAVVKAIFSVAQSLFAGLQSISMNDMRNSYHSSEPRHAQ